MAKDNTLLAQVQRDLIDRKPLADLLRSCLLLGGESGSVELRAWARKELNGYDSEDELPNYRVVPVIIQRDGVSGNWQYRGQHVPISVFPQEVRDVGVLDRVHLRAGVGELEALTDQDATDGKIRLNIPGSHLLGRLLDGENPFEQTTSMYWAMAPATMIGVIDKIRTALTEILAELGAVMPSDQESPTAEQATHAVNLAVNGGLATISFSAPSTSITASGGSTVHGVTGGQSGAAGHDLQQSATYEVMHKEAVKTWLDEYRAALSELDEGVRLIAEQQLDQVTTEIEKDEPQEVVVTTLMGSLRNFAANAVSSAGTGAGTLALAGVLAHWPFS